MALVILLLLGLSSPTSMGDSSTTGMLSPNSGPLGVEFIVALE